MAAVAHMDLDSSVDRIELDKGLGMGFERLAAVVQAFRGVETETGTFLCKANAAVLAVSFHHYQHQGDRRASG